MDMEKLPALPFGLVAPQLRKFRHFDQNLFDPLEQRFVLMSLFRQVGGLPETLRTHAYQFLQ